METAVLLSGGVDSSVALARLVAAGEKVRAFYLKIWLEDEVSYLGQCPWREDLRYARAVAEKFSVPLEVVPLQREYHESVVRRTLSLAERGLTPNPDIMCNTMIKFGAFLAKRGREFRAVATGHYAQIRRRQGRAGLFLSPDPIKDQTYFLSMLAPEQLEKALFPIGDLRKEETRRLAREFGLPTAERKDSQGICFLGKISFVDFLRHHLGEKEGEVLERSTGRLLGRHRGVWFYTIGQRKGLDLPGGPWYVCAKDLDRNIVYVDHGFAAEKHWRKEFVLGDFNLIGDRPREGEKLKIKLRHGPEFLEAEILPGEKNEITVRLARPEKSVAPGQYGVLYRGRECLGGGMILPEEGGLV